VHVCVHVFEWVLYHNLDDLNTIDWIFVG